jgi:hypothetical protein
MIATEKTVCRVDSEPACTKSILLLLFVMFIHFDAAFMPVPAYASANSLRKTQTHFYDGE